MSTSEDVKESLLEHAAEYALRGEHEKAAFCYRRAAEPRAADAGHAHAQFQLGVAYAEGCGVRADPVEAVRYFQLAATQGLAVAHSALGDCYTSGTGVALDVKLAVRHYRKAARKGESGAGRELGRCFRCGAGVDEDWDEAMHWYAIAAGQGDEEAMYWCGVGYMSGNGVPEDHEKAVFWFRKAAELEHACAKGQLGLALMRGRGVPRDMLEGLRYLTEAADAGDMGAQYELAKCSFSANDAPAVARMVHYFELAAGQGHIISQCMLAYWWSCKDTRDPARAANHFHGACLAVARGDCDDEDREKVVDTRNQLAVVREFCAACCLGCGAMRKLKTCSLCKVAQFCSAECLARTWPVHKESCRCWRAAPA